MFQYSYSQIQYCGYKFGGKGPAKCIKKTMSEALCDLIQDYIKRSNKGEV